MTWHISHVFLILSNMVKKIIFIFLFLISILILYQWIENIREDSQEPYINLYLSEEDKILKMKLEEYICGAVAAEMPALFEMEALKAQAVCARTYTVRKMLKEQKYKGGADVSDNVKECQAYVSPERFKERHPYNYKKYEDKIYQAVKETRGIIMIYEGEPIDALYHSACGGKTAGAEEVWHNEISYLKSVKCGYCTLSPRYESRQTITYSQMRKAWNINEEIKSVNIAEKTESGRARKIKINNHIIIEANLFRQKLELPSTWWEFKNEKKELIIKSRGYGHGVGMCQYGANGMAIEGYNYKEILEHYYQNVKFYKIDY